MKSITHAALPLLLVSLALPLRAQTDHSAQTAQGQKKTTEQNHAGSAAPQGSRTTAGANTTHKATPGPPQSTQSSKMYSDRTAAAMQGTEPQGGAGQPIEIKPHSVRKPTPPPTLPNSPS